MTTPGIQPGQQKGKFQIGPSGMDRTIVLALNQLINKITTSQKVRKLLLEEEADAVQALPEFFRKNIAATKPGRQRYMSDY